METQQQAEFNMILSLRIEDALAFSFCQQPVFLLQWSPGLDIAAGALTLEPTRVCETAVEPRYYGNKDRSDDRPLLRVKPMQDRRRIGPVDARCLHATNPRLALRE